MPVLVAFEDAVAAGLPIITETCLSAFPFADSDAVIQASYQNIRAVSGEVLGQDYRQWKDRGLGLRNKIMKEYCFKDNVERALVGSTC